MFVSYLLNACQLIRDNNRKLWTSMMSSQVELGQEDHETFLPTTRKDYGSHFNCFAATLVRANRYHSMFILHKEHGTFFSPLNQIINQFIISEPSDFLFIMGESV